MSRPESYKMGAVGGCFFTPRAPIDSLNSFPLPAEQLKPLNFEDASHPP